MLANVFGSGSKKLTGVSNFRDLYESSQGIIPAGKIFRCATPSEATAEDVRHIVDKLGIKTILDLRTTAESSLDIGENLLRREYTVVPEGSLFKHTEIERLREDHRRMLYQIPIIPSNLSFLRELPYTAKAKLAFYSAFGYTTESHRIIGDMMTNLKLQGLYRLILKTSWKNLLKALEILSDPKNYPVMIHCTQGKDRTGMLVSLIMHMCQVPQSVITSDYAKSEKELEPMRLNAEYMKRNFARAEGLGLDMTSWMLAPADAIEETHTFVNSNFGGYPQYLEWIGFKVIQQAKFKHLIAPSPDDRIFAEKEDVPKNGPFLSDQLGGGPHVSSNRDSKRQSSGLSFNISWGGAAKKDTTAEGQK